MPRTFVWHPRKGPRKTVPLPPEGAGRLRIEQVRSGIGQPGRMRLTLEAIGLRHHQDVIVRDDSPSLRGQLNRVRHLVKVTPIEE